MSSLHDTSNNFVYFFFFLKSWVPYVSSFFFFNDPAPTEIYPFPLHAALQISAPRRGRAAGWGRPRPPRSGRRRAGTPARTGPVGGATGGRRRNRRGPSLPAAAGRRHRAQIGRAHV